MDVKAAAMHFIQLVSAYVAECEEMGEQIDQSIEDWTQDFQAYLEVSLRGRRGVDPNHPIFSDPRVNLLKEMCEDDEGHTRDWRHQMEEVLGWDHCGKVVDADGKPYEHPRFERLDGKLRRGGRPWECCKPRHVGDMTLGMAEAGEFIAESPDDEGES